MVNSNPGPRTRIAAVLASAQFDVVSCATAAEALALLKVAPRTALVVDYTLADMGGIEFVRACAALGLSAATVMTASDAKIPAAVHALREGISDFLPEPYDDRLALAIRRALRESTARRPPSPDGPAAS